MAILSVLSTVFSENLVSELLDAVPSGGRRKFAAIELRLNAAEGHVLSEYLAVKTSEGKQLSSDAMELLALWMRAQEERNRVIGEMLHRTED